MNGRFGGGRSVDRRSGRDRRFGTGGRRRRNLLRNGDRIRLSVKERRIDLVVSEDELRKRKSAWKPPVTAPTRGYAKLYMDHVLQAEHGCDFDFLRKA